ncbi:MAG: methyltransferase domain-containing protein [Pseudomonadota bacterium]
MDLFGDAPRDHQAGARGRLRTIRRDDDHVDAHDPALHFAPDAFARERAVLSHARGAVLAVRCGAGRTVLSLAARGLAVTGIDISPGAVAVARARGGGDIRLGDVLDAGADAGGLSEAAFDTITLLGNNLGIGGTREGCARLPGRLAELARPGGQLFITGLDIADTTEAAHLAHLARNRESGRPMGEIAMRFEYGGTDDAWVPGYHHAAGAQAPFRGGGLAPRDARARSPPLSSARACGAGPRGPCRRSGVCSVAAG